MWANLQIFGGTIVHLSEIKPFFASKARWFVLPAVSSMPVAVVPCWAFGALAVMFFLKKIWEALAYRELPISYLSVAEESQRTRRIRSDSHSVHTCCTT